MLREGAHAAEHGTNNMAQTQRLFESTVASTGATGAGGVDGPHELEVPPGL